jgi:hypothetical protein
VGKADCLNGADEAVCPAFLCSNGAQVFPASANCDRVADCDDGSDARPASLLPAEVSIRAG